MKRILREDPVVKLPTGITIDRTKKSRLDVIQVQVAKMANDQSAAIKYHEICSQPINPKSNRLAP